MTLTEFINTSNYKQRILKTLDSQRSALSERRFVEFAKPLNEELNRISRELDRYHEETCLSVAKEWFSNQFLSANSIEVCSPVHFTTVLMNSSRRVVPGGVHWTSSRWIRGNALLCCETDQVCCQAGSV